MYEIEQEIIDRINDQCGDLFRTVASTMAIAETEVERDLCPAVFVSIGSDDGLSYSMRYMEVEQQWTITLALAPRVHGDRSENLGSVDGGRKLAIINALTVGWRPASARDPIIYTGTGQIYTEFGYTEIPMNFKIKLRYPI